MIFVEFGHDIQHARRALPDCDRCLIAFDVNKGWQAPVWIDLSVPVRLLLAPYIVNADVVIWDATPFLVTDSCRDDWDETDLSSSQRIVSL